MSPGAPQHLGGGDSPGQGDGHDQAFGRGHGVAADHGHAVFPGGLGHTGGKVQGLAAVPVRGPAQGQQGRAAGTPPMAAMSLRFTARDFQPNWARVV